MQSAFVRMVLISGLVVGLAIPVFAADEKVKAADKKSEAAEPETGDVIRTTTQQITGQVSGIDKNYIGVVYQKEDGTESEMGLSIEGTPQLDRVKDLSAIQMGDTVSVEYAVITEKGEGDEEINRHVARKIAFVKPAPPPLPENSVLSSDQGGQ